MKYHLNFRLLFLALAAVFIGANIANAAPQQKKKRAKAKTTIKAAAPVVDFVAVGDSAMIFADDYATAVLEKPEMKGPRLNALRAFFKRQTPAAQDSVTARIYEMAVQCLEQNRPERSAALRECFMAIASDNDPNLGPLYNLELSDAVMHFDTTAVNKYADMLEAYADRMGYDYREELRIARSYVRKVRMRPPLSEALVGVWVSEDIAGFIPPVNPNICFPTYHDGNDFEKEPLITTMPILKIRDSANEIYKGFKYKGKIFHPQLASLDSVYKATKVPGLDFIKSSDRVHSSAGSRYYRPIEAWELPGYGYDPLPQSKIDSARIDGFSPVNNAESTRHSIGYRLFEDEYTAYAVWGDERLKRPNAEIAAVARQSVQQAQAMIAGELSRSKYDFGTQLAGNLAAGLAASLIGGFIDALMVSKEKIWSIEITLTPISPYEMQAVTMAHLVIVRSDSPKPEVYDYEHRTTYYKWFPDDDVYFTGLGVFLGDNPTGEAICLHQVSKQERKRRLEEMCHFSKKFKDQKKKMMKKLKDDIKKAPKNDPEARARAVEALENFMQGTPSFWRWYNNMMLNRLKARAEQYKIDNP